jgi:hypothetical protein
MIYYPISEDELVGLEGGRWHELIERVRGRGAVPLPSGYYTISVPGRFPDDMDGLKK